jgi:GTP-binding protein EngB required for normal cell division
MTESMQERYSIFLQRRARLATLIEQLLIILTSLQLTNLERDLSRLQQEVLADVFKVLVMGEFKRGKSTVINAMLGQHVLPAHSSPTTAIISEVKWGEQPGAILQYLSKPDGSPGGTRAVKIEDLEKHIIIQEDDTTDAYENPYEKVEIFWPLELCQNHIEIIDSPGLNEDPKRQYITINYLAAVDAVIFVVSCDSPVSLTEKDAIKDAIEQGHKNIFFICTHIDKYDDDPKEKERVENYCRRQLRGQTAYGERMIFFVNARKALEGKIHGDMERVDASNILSVEQALKDFLALERGRVKIALPIISMQAWVTDLYKDIPDREKMLQANVSEIDRRHIQMESQLVASAAEAQQIVDRLEQFRLHTEHFIEIAATTFFKTLVPNVLSWAQNCEIKRQLRLPEIVLPEARTRVATEVVHHLSRQLTQEYKEWQKTILLPEFNRRYRKEIDALSTSIRAFTSGLEQARFRLSEETDGATASAKRELQTSIEHLLLNADGTFQSNPDVDAFFAIFSWKASLGGLTSTGAAVALVGILSLNPLVLVPAALLGVIITAVIGTSAVTNAIKIAIGKQYEQKLHDSLEALGSDVKTEYGQRLVQDKNELSRLLFLKIQNIRDQVKAVLLKKQEGQVSVDQELGSLKNVRKQLDCIHNDLLELHREITKER